MVKIEWPEEVVKAAAMRVFTNPFWDDARTLASMRLALTAALAKMQEMGLAEVVDDYEHIYGNDPIRVLIVKIGSE